MTQVNIIFETLIAGMTSQTSNTLMTPMADHTSVINDTNGTGDRSHH